MRIEQAEWIGSWKNFESYFTDEDPEMVQAWQDAERATAAKKKNLIERYLFRHGAKRFWMSGCYTQTDENPFPLGGWEITPVGEEDVRIKWTAMDGRTLAEFTYAFDTVVERGLEGKSNFLLGAMDAPSDSPFRYLLLMPPMPKRTAKEQGGLISHLHFQYGSRKENILRGEKLRKPHWYATMCDAEATKEQECAIVRALHGV